MDCQTIQGFHGDLSFLSPSDIENLDPDVVAECVSEFQEADWDVEQLEKFAMKIKYVREMEKKFKYFLLLCAEKQYLKENSKFVSSYSINL